MLTYIGSNVDSILRHLSQSPTHTGTVLHTEIEASKYFEQSLLAQLPIHTEGYLYTEINRGYFLQVACFIKLSRDPEMLFLPLPNKHHMAVFLYWGQFKHSAHTTS